MKILLSLILLAGTAFAQADPNSTWFIRADGGDLKQCSGLVDAPLSSTTTACALNDLRLLAYPGKGSYAISGKWIIHGGDTVHIGAGQFRVGYAGPNATDHDGLSSAGNPFGSALPPIPSGTAANPTRIIGAGSALTQLYGGYGAGNVFDLSTSAFVEVSGLEITDHSQCTRTGGGYVAPVIGCSSSYPLSDYAGVGIVTGVGTHNVKFSDLNIHGFTSRGILGPIGGLVTVDHVRIAFNGMAGWDFDDGRGTPSSNDAFVKATYLTIEGSGCNEEFPIIHPGFPASSCFDQSSGGYGDGIGTPNSPLNFSCDHCTFRYNTQDGPDLLHSADSSISFTNSTSYGNMGQQWKLGAMSSVIFRNNTTVHNCRRMAAAIGGNSTYNKYLSNFCRAAGDGFAINVKDGGTYIYQNNSFAGYGSTTYDIGCTGSQANIVFQNNLHVGYKNPTDGQYPGVFYLESGCPVNPFKANDHNIYFNMRTVPADGVSTDPHIAGEPTWVNETSLDAVDFHLTSASTNAIGQGVAGVDIGAYGAADSIATVTPPADGGATTPPVDGGSTTAPSVTIPTGFTINIVLTCTPSGTVFNCGPKAP